MHVRETRTRIIAAALEELQQRGSLSLARVARRAGVAVPTAYRHFRSASALHKAVLAHILVLAEQRKPAENLDQLIRTIPTWFDHFDRHRSVVRALLFMTAFPDVRQHMLKRRKTEVVRVLREVTDGMPDPDALRAAALVHVLHSAPAWELMRQYGLSGREAGAASAWAVRVVVAAMRREGRILENQRRAA